MEVSRPKLSRRLKKLVEANVIGKSVIPGWPPSSYYWLTSERVEETASSSKPTVRPYKTCGRAHWVAAGFLGMGLLISLVGLLSASQRCSSLQADLRSKEVELVRLSNELAATRATLRQVELKLSSEGTANRAFSGEQNLLAAGEESPDSLEELCRKPVSTVIIKLPDGRFESRAIFEDGSWGWFVFGDPPAPDYGRLQVSVDGGDRR